MKTLLSLNFFIFISIITGFTQQRIPVTAGKDVAVVSTVNGNVRGFIHNGIYIYKGIPYASANRFEAPQRISWTGVRSSMTYGPVCPIDPTTSVNDEFEFAFDHDLGYQNENCQSLNIWTNSINTNTKKPVMVWLHGGGFTNGSSIELPSYDGEQLARKDVVLVSINHRLNILGFLNLEAYNEKYKSSANNGLLDIQMSLQWIKDNIAMFGGDPNNITIFGQSGGGAKVTALMSAPSAKGLFNKAIIESGSYLNNFLDPKVSKRIAEVVLEQLKITPDKIDSIKNVPYDQLSRAGHQALSIVYKEMISAGNSSPAFGLDWGPVLDNVFLPFQPYDLEALKLSSEIPVIIGTTKNEFAPFNPTTRNISIDQAKNILKTRYKDNSDEYFEAVRKAYPDTRKPPDYTDLDMIFRSGALKQANAITSYRNSSAPVFMYLFTWQSPVNDGIYKAFHCMDIAFQFNNIKRCEQMTGGGADAYALADKISQSWVNFATTGIPNAKGLPQWPAYSKSNGATMILDNVSTIKYHHDAALLTIANSK